MTNDINAAYLIKHEDILCTWDGADGKSHEDFDNELALSYLLLEGHIFVNSRWRRNEDKGDITLVVVCNDIFAWACSDAQALPYSELRHLYERVRQDPKWGAAKWCIEQRGEMPQKPVENAIRTAGLWDIDETKLQPNRANAQAQAGFAEAARSTRRVLHPRDLTTEQRDALTNAKTPAGNEQLDELMGDDPESHQGEPEYRPLSQ